MIILKTVDLAGLEVFNNIYDSHHDVFIYLDYVRSRSVKRGARDNSLTKADALQLARRMSDPSGEEKVKESGSSAWVNFIDRLAWKLGLVNYDVKGEYTSYTSTSLTFRDNYIVVNETGAQGFRSLAPIKQEEMIRAALVNQQLEEYNEFFDTSEVGRLHSFISWGRTNSVASQVNFSQARRYLLSLLAELQSGTWYRTDALAQYVKENRPYFLIPEQVQPVYLGRPAIRYMGFSESKKTWGQYGEFIDEKDSDSFERVEGRFIERFLEGIPLLLRYVEVAYQTAPYQGVYPEQNMLQAFRVNDRFLHLMQAEIPKTQITVQPNFEIVVVSEVYPSDQMDRLLPFSEIVSESIGQAGPSVYTLRLKKEHVAAEVANQPDLNIIELLTQLSSQPLAQNVIVELKEWSAHSNVFTLYEDAALLESQQPPEEVERYLAAQIAPGLHLVRKPQLVYRKLDALDLVPLAIQHGPEALSILPDQAHTVFPTPSRPAEEEVPIEPVVIRREERVMLRFNGSRTAFEAFRNAMVERHIPVDTDERDQTIAYPKKYDHLLEEIVNQLKDHFDTSLHEVW